MYHLPIGSTCPELLQLNIRRPHNGAMATTTSADATGTEKTTTSPLPQDAQASEPTDAKGTVDDRTVTGIEEQLNKEGETADSVTKTATEGTKEFYTISTKSRCV